MVNFDERMDDRKLDSIEKDCSAIILTNMDHSMEGGLVKRRLSREWS